MAIGLVGCEDPPGTPIEPKGGFNRSKVNYSAPRLIDPVVVTVPTGRYERRLTASLEVRLPPLQGKEGFSFQGAVEVEGRLIPRAVRLDLFRVAGKSRRVLHAAMAICEKSDEGVTFRIDLRIPRQSGDYEIEIHFFPSEEGSQAYAHGILKI